MRQTMTCQREVETDSKEGAHRCQPAVQAKNSGAPIENKWKRKCSKCMTNYLVEVERIDSKIVTEKGHEHFIAGCQVNWRKCSRVHIDTGLTHIDGLVKVQELSESSMEIDHVILIRPPHEQNRGCISYTQDQ